ncbi:MAG TPA: hypothetical protein VGK80_05120 [Rhodanobacteraceae bacterium]
MKLANRGSDESWKCIIVAGVAIGSCLASASVASAPGRWKIISSPSIGTINQLNAAAAISGSDAWAVGTTGLPDFNSQGVILHWNGNRWQRIRHPNPAGAVFMNLIGVAASSADDAWAVGRWGDAGLGVHPLALHWNGSSWQLIDTPVLSGGDTFQAVTAISPNDVWAVGQDATGTLAEHWDGQSWSVVPTPTVQQGGDLTAVGGSSSTDVWAVGSFFDRKLQTHSMVLHWDGSRWSVSASPDNGASSELEGVTALAADDAWAVGHSFPSNVATLTEHWDGTSWTVVSGPDLSPAQFNAVVAVSPRDVWAVGWALGPGAQKQTLAENWNGSAWVVSQTPTANQISEFLGITASPQAVLAVGDANATPQDPQQTLMEVHVQ